ncbi:MAG: hypothetical protein H6807_17315 [Planctomycetes bacterium]|nr:hypothetical protein [Planctomycetota bacterium]
MTNRQLVLLLLLGALTVPLAAQGTSSAKLEPPDVYAFPATPPFEPRYQHDEKRERIILNPDFFCSVCAEEGRIKFKSRDEMKDVLEQTKKFPYPLNDGTKERHHGRFRLMNRPAQDVLDFIYSKKQKAKNPVFIEDPQIRLYADLPGFSTKKFTWDRRGEELQLLSDIFPEVSEKTVVLNPHQHAHLYLIRAHRLLREFSWMVNVDAHKKDLEYLGPYLGCMEKFEIFIFQKKKNLDDFLLQHLGAAGEDGRCWHNLDDKSMATILHGQNLEDYEIMNTFTHRFCYNMLGGYRLYQYDLPAWVVLGFAHVMERRERTDFNTFIFGEAKVPDLPNVSKWKVHIRKLVVKDDIPRSLPEIADIENVAQVSVDEHLILWSLMSYLMQQDLQKTGVFFNVLKEKKEGESTRNNVIRALRTAYGVSIPVLWEQWREWVKETYPAV